MGRTMPLLKTWASIAAKDYATAQANATGDLTALTNSIIGALGTVLGVIGIVIAVV